MHQQAVVLIMVSLLHIIKNNGKWLDKKGIARRVKLSRHPTRTGSSRHALDELTYYSIPAYKKKNGASRTFRYDYYVTTYARLFALHSAVGMRTYNFPTAPLTRH